ncbi:MAG: YggS family pyridoxal phosphate-dependent enzyme [Clostridia bacterium]|nr:YggS family pyridoxal phosphate-dependent enzyme [Clostridia bacterium]
MDIRENLEQVQKEIVSAALDAGRNPKDVRLIAVSKTKPLSMVEEAADCGMMDFGENRPQELAEKQAQRPDLRWHQIGQLQKNKVRHIIDKVALIHSVDSLSLAEEIEKRAGVIDKIQDILIQVNISGEESKSGVKPEEAAELCRAISTLSHIRIRGLMTISVQGMSDEENFALFSRLRELAQEIDALKLDGVSMQELSMGMTHDFLPAIRAGATMIRVGSGIFGVREYL